MLEDGWNAIHRATQRSRCPVELRRIDQSEGDFEVSQRIMDEIDRCEFMIADLTHSPPNVYLEIGYARGVGKPIILVARTGTLLEFNLRTWKTRFYRNATELEEILVPAIKEQCREWRERVRDPKKPQRPGPRTPTRSS